MLILKLISQNIIHKKFFRDNCAYFIKVYFLLFYCIFFFLDPFLFFFCQFNFFFFKFNIDNGKIDNTQYNKSG